MSESDTKVIVTQWDEDGNEIVTESKAFTETYPGQIDEIIAAIESGLSARRALYIYTRPLIPSPEDEGK